MTRKIARSILDRFIRSDYFAQWQAERIESGAYSRYDEDCERFARVHDAAENGADGSTHAEHIQDMRDAFSDWLRDRRRTSKLRFAEPLYRVQAAVDAELDDLEAWHRVNGSLEQEIG